MSGVAGSDVLCPSCGYGDVLYEEVRFVPGGLLAPLLCTSCEHRWDAPYVPLVSNASDHPTSEHAPCTPPDAPASASAAARADSSQPDP